jgi:hypothetical protein
MHSVLLAHPATPPGAAIRIETEILRHRGEFEVSFFVGGQIDRVVFAPRATSIRVDGLWRTTCFEAFLQAADEPAYVELNLAPSSRWAAYRFSSYRDGMAPGETPAPRIEMETSEEQFRLRAFIDIGSLLSPEALWRVGLSAVIEETDETKSYFALAHPSGKPDFHDSRGFLIEARP